MLAKPIPNDMVTREPLHFANRVSVYDKGEQHGGERLHEDVRAGPLVKQESVALRSQRTESGRVRVGCLSDEIQNLLGPTERLHTDVQSGPQRGRMPERCG